MRADQLDSEFRQRILAASRGPEDPELYSHIFKDEQPINGVDHDGIFFPTTEEEFAEMEDYWKEVGTEGLPPSAAEAFASSLGYAPVE